MFLTKKMSRILLLIAALWCLTSPGLYAQSNSENVCTETTRVDGSNIAGSNIDRILRALALKCNLRVAFIAKQHRSPVITFSASGVPYFPLERNIVPASGSLASILDKLLAPGYSWTINGDFLEVTPREGVRPEIQRFLSAKVIGPEINYSQAQTRSYSVSFNITTKQPIIRSTDVFSSPDGLGPDRMKKPTTVREMLDSATRYDSFRYWEIYVARIRGKKILTLTMLDRLVI